MEKTIINLAAAFIGESQARNRYGRYAKVARNEGYEQIAAIFNDTADQEREHAAQLFKMLQTLKGEKKEIMVENAGVSLDFGTTAENLQSAMKGENHEHTSMYPEFAKIADEEGLVDVANRLRAIAKAEAHHEERYAKLLKEIQAGTVFQKDKETIWVCRECGYVHVGLEAPKECPSCSHAQAFYQVQNENY
ncbi:MAG: rubrerythrin family protein [Patescibacteria group bacterium]